MHTTSHEEADHFSVSLLASNWGMCALICIGLPSHRMTSMQIHLKLSLRFSSCLALSDKTSLLKQSGREPSIRCARMLHGCWREQQLLPPSCFWPSSWPWNILKLRHLGKVIAPFVYIALVFQPPNTSRNFNQRNVSPTRNNSFIDLHPKHNSHDGDSIEVG